MPGKDSVLIEIITAANMAGIEQAKAGFLGMSPAVLGLAAGLGVLVAGGKFAMETAKQQEEAEKGLTNALKDRNALAGHLIQPDASAHAKIAKAIQAHKDALEKLAAAERGTYIPATHLTELQLMKLQDAEQRVAETTGTAHERALRRLSELQVQYSEHVHGATTRLGNLSAAQERVAKTAHDLAVLQATVGQAVKLTGINAQDVEEELRNFIQTNRDYISNQYDVYNSTAALVREGVSLKDLTRDQNLILDLSAAKHISVAEATGLVTRAQAGNFKGLKDLLGITTPVIKAGDSLAEKTHKIGTAMDLAASKVHDAKKAIDPLQGSLNSLKITAQEYATGPGKQLNDAFAAGIGIIDLFGQALLKLGQDDAMWAGVSRRLVELAQDARNLALALGFAQPTKQEISDRGQTDYLYNHPEAKFIQDSPGLTIKEYEKMIAASNAANLKSHNDMLAIQKKIDDGNKAFRDFATVIRDRKSELIVNVNVPPASDPRFNQNHQYRQLVGV